MADEEVQNEPVAEEVVVAPVAEVVEAPIAEPIIDDSARVEKMPKWGWDRLHEETNKRQAEAAARAEAVKEAQTYREMLERIQRGEKADALPAAKADPAPDQARYQEDVRAEAASMRLREDSAKVLADGNAAFPDFADALTALTAVNATTDAFVADVLAVDRENAHVVFHKLAQDPGRAAVIARMDPRARIAELTRMSMAEAPKKTPVAPAEQPKPTRVSAAPAPRPAMDPTGAPNNDNWMSDDVTDEQFFAGFKAKFKIA